MAKVEASAQNADAKVKLTIWSKIRSQKSESQASLTENLVRGFLCDSKINVILV